MEQNELKYWIFFSKISKLGPVKFKKLYNYFPDMRTAYQADFNELQQSGLEENVIHEIIVKKQEIDPDQELANLTKENIKVITIKDDQYPLLLKEIHNPPAVIYYQGNLINENNAEELTIAIVGSRKATDYGLKVTREITEGLGARNITIVSGLALGIDTAAHQATIKQGKRTIAVLGSGLDKQSLYPKQNQILKERIVEHNGAVISEFPAGTLPLPEHFPQRNRIIAGLSIATLVIEAAETSGALITARDALEQNREVMAVPGSIYNPLSIGPNNLIKMGAKTITKVEDILEILNLE